MIRSGLSVAIVAMVKYESTHPNDTYGTCLASNHTSNDAIRDGKFEWSESLQVLYCYLNYYKIFVEENRLFKTFHNLT